MKKSEQENEMKREQEKRNDAWWHRLPDGEKAFLRDLRQMIKGAKQSELYGVARAAKQWESRLIFFVRCQLMGRKFKRG